MLQISTGLERLRVSLRFAVQILRNLREEEFYKLRYERMSDGYVRKSLMRSNLANEASIAISSAAITSDTRQRCHKYDVWSFMTPFTSLQQPLDRSRRTRRRMARDP